MRNRERKDGADRERGRGREGRETQRETQKRNQELNQA